MATITHNSTCGAGVGGENKVCEGETSIQPSTVEGTITLTFSGQLYCDCVFSQTIFTYMGTNSTVTPWFYRFNVFKNNSNTEVSNIRTGVFIVILSPSITPNIFIIR